MLVAPGDSISRRRAVSFAVLASRKPVCFAVLAVLCSQDKPRVRHNEQGALAFRVAERAGEFEAFLGIQSILRYPFVFGHESVPFVSKDAFPSPNGA